MNKTKPLQTLTQLKSGMQMSWQGHRHQHAYTQFGIIRRVSWFLCKMPQFFLKHSVFLNTFFQKPKGFFDGFSISY